MNRTVRLQPSNYQTQGLKTGPLRQYPRARPLFGSPKILSTPSQARSEGIGDSQLQEHGVGSPRILPVSQFSDYFPDIESIVSSGRAMAILSEITSSYKDARPSLRELRLFSLLLNHHHTCQNRQPGPCRCLARSYPGSLPPTTRTRPPVILASIKVLKTTPSSDNTITCGDSST